MLRRQHILTYVGWNIVNFYATKVKAMLRAINLSETKGIINIGSGCDWSSNAMAFCKLPQVMVNIDIHVTEDCPKCEWIDLENAPLPFTDKEFDVAWASHCLEHLTNWQGALTEWQRIADHVIVILPNPLGIDALHLNPQHKQHFSFADMRAMRSQGIEVFT